MKKNRMMRLASVLLVLTLLSTSVISGTFAKYVTSDQASDTARVAKFGVVVSASGSLFGTDYVQKDDGNIPGSTNLTVVSSGGVVGNVVAPGTKSSDEGLAFAVTGTPEVKVEVKVAVTDVKDVFLNAKNGLPDMTTGDTLDTFDNSTNYYPVKYTLTQTTAGGSITPLVSDGKLTEVVTKLEALSTTYDANTNLADVVGTLKLTWEWDFDNSGAGTYDRQDTLLGDLAAGIILPAPVLHEGTDYNLQTGLTISITVTQVD